MYHLLPFVQLISEYEMLHFRSHCNNTMGNDAWKAQQYVRLRITFQSKMVRRIRNVFQVIRKLLLVEISQMFR